MKFAVLIAITAAGVSGQPAARNPFAGDATAAEAGRGTFRIYCAPCHGLKAEGLRAPDLTRGVYSVGDTDADLFRVISEGAQGTEMPGFAERLGDAENVWRIVTYIRSITRRDTAPPKGNAQNGEKLYWSKGGCAQCHRAGGKGGRLGPDLSRIGRERSYTYLRESILKPNAEITPGYATILVVTRDGKKITGVQRGFDNFSAQLMDMSEKFHSFERTAVSSITREFRSMMPDTYGKMFSPSELDDLLAYMVSLRGTEGSKK
jgi:putative heme-binding domain-containing protein